MDDDYRAYALAVAAGLEPCDVETLLDDADRIVEWLRGAECTRGEATVVQFTPMDGGLADTDA